MLTQLASIVLSATSLLGYQPVPVQHVEFVYQQIQPLEPPPSPCDYPPSDFGLQKWIDKLTERCGKACDPVMINECYHMRAVDCDCIQGLLHNYTTCLLQKEAEYRAAACECFQDADFDHDGILEPGEGTWAQVEHCIGLAWATSQVHAKICYDAQDIQGCCRFTGDVDCPR